MDQSTEPIKQEIDETREAMTARMEQIESRVQGTVENVKGTAQEAVENVKQKLDVKRMVDQRPWTMLGAAMLVGFTLGSMGGSDEPRREYSSGQSGRAYRYYDDEVRYDIDHPPQSTASREFTGKRNGHDDEQRYSHPRSEQDRSQSGLTAGVKDQFSDEFEAIKTALVTTASNSLRSMLRENVPQFADEFERVRKEREARAAQQESKQVPETFSSHRVFPSIDQTP